MRGLAPLLIAAVAQSALTSAFTPLHTTTAVGRVVSQSTPSVVGYPGQANFFDGRLKAENTPSTEEQSKLPVFLDIGTKGGAVFLSLCLFIAPIIAYNVILAVTDIDALDLGTWIGVGFTAVATLAWLGTYLFRVATKDMTYVRRGRINNSCQLSYSTTTCSPFLL
jgi:hypothetical protein